MTVNDLWAEVYVQAQEIRADKAAIKFLADAVSSLTDRVRILEQAKTKPGFMDEANRRLGGGNVDWEPFDLEGE